MVEEKGVFLIILIQKSDFSQSWKRFEYAVYSISSSQYIEKETDEYRLIIRDLPSLADYQETDGDMDFLEECRYEDEFYGIVEEIGPNGTISDDLQERYINYLNEISNKKSPFLQTIYSYCLKLIKTD